RQGGGGPMPDASGRGAPRPGRAPTLRRGAVQAHRGRAGGGGAGCGARRGVRPPRRLRSDRRPVRPWLWRGWGGGGPARLSAGPFASSGAPAEGDAAVHGAQLEAPAARADRALDPPAVEASLDGEGEVGRDGAVDGPGTDLGVRIRRELDGDAAVDGLAVDLACPVGTTEGRADGAVDGRGPCEAGSGDLDRSVDGPCHDVAREATRLDLAVHGPPGEMHARGDTHDEIDSDVVVAGAHPAAGSGGALVGAAAAVGVDGADGDAVVVLDHVEGDLVRVAPPGGFGGDDLDDVPLGVDGANVYKDDIDLDIPPRIEHSVPAA